ncbi:alpha-galactosidase [Actinoplanes sp. NPDC049668]|uniref:alpha-galactosidase n=1 Tax=unclassified Actinoplanes TaxID=2626549 RepID=UPI0033A9ABF3
MNTVEICDDTTTVAIHAGAVTYAIRLDVEAGVIQPVHWGPRLSIGAAASLPARPSPHPDTFEAPWEAAEDYPAEGGRTFGPAALGAWFPDGTTGLELSIVGHGARDGAFTVTLADRHQPLAVDLYYRPAPGTDVVERWAVVRHTGDAGDGDIVLHRQDAGAWCVPPRDDYRMSHVTGAWSAEGMLHRTPVPTAQTQLTSRRGVTGHHANPWIMIDDGTAGEEHGEVWSMALATSGSWRITAARSHAGRCAVTGGAGHDGVRHRLHPGETLTSPVFAGLYTAEGFGAASRAWHAYQRRHISPHPGELRPVLYNSWEATTFDVTEQGQLALAELAADLGVELFVVDDGWFGARTSDSAGLGDWHPNPDRFPDGLRPLADRIRRLGMQFGLWVEPEMTNPDSDLYRSHPDWVHHSPGRRRTELRNQLVLDFTRADVREWAWKWLDRLVRDTGAAFLKWDFNRPITEAADPAWTGHAAGVYAVIHRLRVAHPGLRIESCAGGGGRIDLGVLRRTDQVWASDNTDAVDRLTIQHGHTQLYTPATMVAWVTDSPNPLTGREVPLRFRFHVAMTGVLGIGGDLTRWSPGDRDTARELIRLYRDVRPTVQHGDLYRLRPPRATTSAVQYVHGDHTVVFAFRVGADFAPHEPALLLRGLDPQAVYRDDDTGEQYPAGVLMACGLRLALPGGAHASTMTRLTRIAAGGS